MAPAILGLWIEQTEGANLHPQRIEEHHRIHRLERAASATPSPSPTMRIGDGANQIGETSTAYMSARKPCISRTVIPRA